MLETPRRWLRRLYNWTLHWAETPNALTALFVLAVAEASVFPIPPDILLIAIVAARPKRWVRAALLCTVGSILGATLGYGVGTGAMATLGQPIINFYGVQPQWNRVVEIYTGELGVWFLLIAAFSPIPFKVATIAAGATEMAFWPFLVISAIGRGSRFFLVAAILRILGAPVRKMIEKYFDLAALLFVLLLFGGFLVFTIL